MCLLKVSLLTPTKLEPIESSLNTRPLLRLGVFMVFSSYRRFIRHFISIMAPIINGLKKGPLQWTPKAASSFKEIEEMMSSAPILRHPDFSKVSKVACDASRYRHIALVER